MQGLFVPVHINEVWTSGLGSASLPHPHRTIDPSSPQRPAEQLALARIRPAGPSRRRELAVSARNGRARGAAWRGPFRPAPLRVGARAELARRRATVGLRGRALVDLVAAWRADVLISVEAGPARRNAPHVIGALHLHGVSLSRQAGREAGTAAGGPALLIVAIHDP